MTVPPELPDHATLMGMRRDGRTLREIADALDVTPSEVWRQLTDGAQGAQQDTQASAGSAAGDPRSVEEMTGWDIDARHRNTGAMRRLMTFNRMQQGLDVEEPHRRDLLDWVQEMNGVGVVLDYHPEASPNDACRTGGFYFRRREAADEYFFRRHG